VRISFVSKGNTDKTDRFLNAMERNQMYRSLTKYAQQGVQALASNTPTDSGATAAAWGYIVEVSRSSSSITWTNDNQNDGAQIAILLQFGHGTGTGGYVRGRDYINPAVQPIMDLIADGVWKEVVLA
jgi:hypothetical protein